MKPNKFAKLSLLFFASVALVLSFQNCAKFKANQSPLDSDLNSEINDFYQGTSTGNPGQQKVGFQQVYNQVFRENCVSCHGVDRADKGIRYDSYESAIEFGELNYLNDSYHNHIEPGPECRQITHQQMDLISLWIDSGAKEKPGMDLKSLLDGPGAKERRPRHHDRP